MEVVSAKNRDYLSLQLLETDAAAVVFLVLAAKRMILRTQEDAVRRALQVLMVLAEILAEEFSTTGASLWLVEIEGDLSYFPQNYLFDLYLIVLPAQ